MSKKEKGKIILYVSVMLCEDFKSGKLHFCAIGRSGSWIISIQKPLYTYHRLTLTSSLTLDVFH